MALSIYQQHPFVSLTITEGNSEITTKLTYEEFVTMMKECEYISKNVGHNLRMRSEDILRNLNQKPQES